MLFSFYYLLFFFVVTIFFDLLLFFVFISSSILFPISFICAAYLVPAFIHKFTFLLLFCDVSILLLHYFTFFLVAYTVLKHKRYFAWKITQIASEKSNTLSYLFFIPNRFSHPFVVFALPCDHSYMKWTGCSWLNFKTRTCVMCNKRGGKGDNRNVNTNLQHKFIIISIMIGSD